MKYCPLMSFQKSGSVNPRTPCLEEQCGFADETGDCLIRKALELCVKDKIRQNEAETKQLEINKLWLDQYFKKEFKKESKNNE